MWIISRIKRIEERMDILEKRISRICDETNEKMADTTKRILRQPEELSKELDDMDDIDAFIQTFINN